MNDTITALEAAVDHDPMDHGARAALSDALRESGYSASADEHAAKVGPFSPRYRNTSAKGDTYEPAEPAEVQPTGIEKFKPVDIHGISGEPTQTRIHEPRIVEHGKADHDAYRVYFPSRKNGKAAMLFSLLGAKEIKAAKKQLEKAGGSLLNLPSVAAHGVGTGNSWEERIANYVAAGGHLTPPTTPKPPAAGALPPGHKRVSGGQIDGEWMPDESANGGRMSYRSRRLRGGGQIVPVGGELPGHGIVSDVTIGGRGEVRYTVRPPSAVEAQAAESRRASDAKNGETWSAATAGSKSSAHWPASLPAVKWTEHTGTGTGERSPVRRYTATLPDGRPVGKEARTIGDDYRETYHFPADTDQFAAGKIFPGDSKPIGISENQIAHSRAFGAHYSAAYKADAKLASIAINGYRRRVDAATTTEDVNRIFADYLAELSKIADQ